MHQTNTHSFPKVTYSLNWQGPVSLAWYGDRGLLARETTTWQGQDYETYSVTTRYSAGRIDVADGSTYGDEIAVPPMRSEDWQRFQHWLENFGTNTTWTLDQLVQAYEQTNPRILWAEL